MTTTTENTETRNPKSKRPKNTPQVVQHPPNRSVIQTKHGSEKPNSMKKEKFQTETAASAGNQTGLWSIFAQHGEPNVTTAKRWDTLPKFANPRPSAG